MKAKMITTLTQDLNKFNVKIDSLQYLEKKGIKSFYIHLVSNHDNNITKLVRFLTKNHTDKFTFSLNEIRYDKKSKKYFTELKVKIL